MIIKEWDISCKLSKTIHVTLSRHELERLARGEVVVDTFLGVNLSITKENNV